MSLVQGLPGYVTATSGVDITVGLKKTGFNGPVLAGKVADPAVAGGPLPTPGGVICVQSTASLLNQVVTTSATGLQRASFIYLPVTTGPLVGAAAPPYVGVGTPLVWNDNLAQLQIWSSGKASWMTLIATTSMSAGGFTTSV
jgi:hypothetical protein